MEMFSLLSPICWKFSFSFLLRKLMYPMAIRFKKSRNSQLVFSLNFLIILNVAKQLSRSHWYLFIKVFKKNKQTKGFESARRTILHRYSSM